MLDLTQFIFFVITRDHESYIKETLESIKKHIGPDVQILLIDTGSVDSTYEIATSYLAINFSDFSTFRLERGTSSLEALKFASNISHRSYLVGISGDDQFGSDYKSALVEYSALSTLDNSVGFVKKYICDENMSFLKLKKNSWSVSRKVNRFKLELSNPGNPIGVILPWRFMIEIDLFKKIPPILVEDYWLWLKLVRSCNFSNLTNGSVLYRVHPYGLSSQSRSTQYAFSLGYCSGLALNTSRVFFGKLVNIFLVIRMIRHLSLQVYPDFKRGWNEGRIDSESV